MKIGIVLPNWIGDVVMATPTLRAIRNYFGADAEIAGVMRPYVSRVLDGTKWLDHTFLYDRKASLPQLHTIPLLRELRRWGPQTMVLLTNSLRAGAIGWLSGAGRRIGYARYGRRLLLTHPLNPPREGWKLQPISAVDYYLQLAYALGCPVEPPRLELATLPRDEAGADRVWSNLKLYQTRRVVLFNTGSATSPARDWPQDSFVALARRIVNDPENAVVVLCGPGEKEAAAAIQQAADHPRVHSMADQDLGLGVAKAVVRRSQLMVTTDSGPRHVAAAFNLHVLTLSGPIDPRWSDTHHDRSLTVQHPLDCAPCGKSICPLIHNDCMRKMTVDRVFAAAQLQLAAVDAAAHATTNERRSA